MGPGCREARGGQANVSVTAAEVIAPEANTYTADSRDKLVEFAGTRESARA